MQMTILNDSMQPAAPPSTEIIGPIKAPLMSAAIRCRWLVTLMYAEACSNHVSHVLERLAQSYEFSCDIFVVHGSQDKSHLNAQC